MKTAPKANTERAARALDLTHLVVDADPSTAPRTEQYRTALAEWLDGVRKLRQSSVRVMCLHLEMVREDSENAATETADKAQRRAAARGQA
jgi:hypothetical protein